MVALKKNSTEAHGSQVLDQQGRGRGGRCQTLSPVLIGLQPGKEDRGIAHGLDPWGQHSWSWDGGGRGSQDLMLLGQGIQWRGSGWDLLEERAPPEASAEASWLSFSCGLGCLIGWHRGLSALGWNPGV